MLGLEAVARKFRLGSRDSSSFTNPASSVVRAELEEIGSEKYEKA